MIYFLIFCWFPVSSNTSLLFFFIIVEALGEQGLNVIFCFIFYFVLFFPVGSPTGPDTFENVKYLRLEI